MIIDKLDNFLKSITKSEAKYKKGVRNKWWDQYEVVNRREGSALKITEPDFFNKELQAAPILDVKKHSRFQDCPLHFHNFIEINYMYAGECTQIINGKPFRLKKGQILLIDSDTIHTIERLGEEDILINLFIKKDFLHNYFTNKLLANNIIVNFFINSILSNTAHNNFIFFHSENNRRSSVILNELLYEYYFPTINSIDILNNLFFLLMSELVNIREKDIYNNELLYKNAPFVEILRYIDKNYKECSLKSLSNEFNVNANYLSEIIKQNTGYSFQELIHQKKFNEAELLLINSQLSIQEIANYIGYSNLSFFYKKFRKIYACTPDEYRKLNKS